MSYGGVAILAILGFLISLVFTDLLVKRLSVKQVGQHIRDEGPSSHIKKQGTPTMGGLSIVIGTSTIFLMFTDFNILNIVTILTFLLFAGIGFLDDYLKVVKKQNLGLRAYQKFLLQLIIAVAFSIYIGYFSKLGTQVWIPFIDKNIDFGYMFVPFIAFVIVSVVNAVNLTDGLDGLAAGVASINLGFLGFLGIALSALNASSLSSAALGTTLAFLIFNKYPAKIFMGDTGSLALGAAISISVVLMNRVLLLPFIGFVFVIEALSVIIQVLSFKIRKKRVFKMSPLHHHFELSGLEEKSVVLLFLGISFIALFLTFGILQI